MRSSLGGTDGASACDSRVNAQQSRAGSELRELNVRYAEGLGSVELLIDRLRRGLSVVNLPIRCCPMCCPTRPRCCPLSRCVVRLSGDQETLALGRLLILAFARCGEFDGEEGLDAGVQIEGFAGPAGSDDAGIGMMEAVHLS
jgi:hypothetical protein